MEIEYSRLLMTIKQQDARIEELEEALKHCRRWFEAMIGVLEQMGASMIWARNVLGIITNLLKRSKI